MLSNPPCVPIRGVLQTRASSDCPVFLTPVSLTRISFSGVHICNAFKILDLLFQHVHLPLVYLEQHAILFSYRCPCLADEIDCPMLTKNSLEPRVTKFLNFRFIAGRVRLK